jgi:outer membrane protein OmpA-like peptidoglycan-associated protein
VNKAPQVKIEVAGYTDNVGDGKRNLNLSIDRAEAVVKYLTGKGVATAQLTAKGYGSDNPVADNATPEGRQKNRRIELRPVPSKRHLVQLNQKPRGAKGARAFFIQFNEPL